MQPFNHSSGNILACGTAAIYCEITGDKTKPALLFLHGGFGTIEDFNSILPSLAGDFNVIGIELIIRGDQDHLTSRRAVVDLADIVDQSNLFNVPFAGHVAFPQQGKIVADVINQFLQSDK